MPGSTRAEQWHGWCSTPNTKRGASALGTSSAPFTAAELKKLSPMLKQTLEKKRNTQHTALRYVKRADWELMAARLPADMLRAAKADGSAMSSVARRLILLITAATTEVPPADGGDSSEAPY